MLRNVKDLQGYAIRYLVVKTSNWWVGHRMLIAPPWIEAVHWSTATVSVDLTRHAIQNAPPYDAVAPFTREQEQGMYEHYGRTACWTIQAHHDDVVPATR